MFLMFIPKIGKDEAILTTVIFFSDKFGGFNHGNKFSKISIKSIVGTSGGSVHNTLGQWAVWTVFPPVFRRPEELMSSLWSAFGTATTCKNKVTQATGRTQRLKIMGDFFSNKMNPEEFPLNLYMCT